MATVIAEEGSPVSPVSPGDKVKVPMDVEVTTDSAFPRMTYVESDLEFETDLEEVNEEDEEENFVTTALFRTAEEGNLSGLQELHENVSSLNLNQNNKHGETALHMAASGGHLDIIEYLHSKGTDLTVKDKHGDGAVYWAARQGHVNVIQYLKEQGVSLDTQNKAGEAAIHVAARYGHTQVIEYLCSAHCDCNGQDKLGETALHNAAWHGLPRVCALLCRAGCKLDLVNKEDETPLHCASVRGNLECVKVLVDAGANLDPGDKKGNTALQLACRRHYSSIALLLLHAGSSMDAADVAGETSLHSACKEGLLTIVQTMCAFGCNVDVASKTGLTPLHVASRSGHTEIVRCLLLSGASPEIPNKEGVTCEIMALAQGHRDIAELLTRLKPEKKEICMKQLMPTNQPLNRIKVKVFGHSGVGKTTLIDSLKVGYIGSLFRRSRSREGPIYRERSLENCKEQEPNVPLQMTYEVAHENYTKGIDVLQCNVAGVGELSLWEFSGYEPYYMLYDHFIGDVNCIHAIVYSLSEPLEDQLAQVKFWLNFIKARIATQEPVAHGGRQPFPANVALVATHADKANCPKDSNGDYTSSDGAAIYGTVREMFKEDFFIHEQLFVCDANAASSNEIKALKSYLTACKADIVQTLPTSKGFLNAVITELPNFRKTCPGYPVLTWPSFAEYIRSKVNNLASEDHLRELMHQLQLVGEVVYLETEKDHDLVIMNPKWLCNEVIGHMLSHDQLMHSRPTGCFTAEDIQIMFPETEAENILKVLEALELCTQCDLEGDIEYEFPSFNFIETLRGLWEKDTKNMEDAAYGGVRWETPRGVQNQLVHVFPRIQVQMRRIINGDNNNPENDLYQWYHGSKFCSGYLESLVTLEQNDQVIEIKARGPRDMSATLYHFFDDICRIAEQVIMQCCPGIVLEKQVISVVDLKEHHETLRVYPTHELLKLTLRNSCKARLDDNNEELFEDIMCFGSDEINSSMTFGVDLHISNLPHDARRQLSLLLDPPNKMGCDWCLLAVTLGLSENVPALDNTKNFPISKTDQALAAWSREPQATVSKLIHKLEELGRQDAVDAVLMRVPLFKLVAEDASQDDTGATPASQSSQSTISR